MPRDEFSLVFHVVLFLYEDVSVIVATLELILEGDLMARLGSWDNETPFLI